jgi:hypothetical protein
MKKSELKQIIKEEIVKILTEAKTLKLKSIDFNKLKKMMINASDMKLNSKEDFDRTIGKLKQIGIELAKGKKSFSNYIFKLDSPGNLPGADLSGMHLDGDAKDLEEKNPKLYDVATSLDLLLGRFDWIKQDGGDFEYTVETYNEIADIVNNYKM